MLPLVFERRNKFQVHAMVIYQDRIKEKIVVILKQKDMTIFRRKHLDTVKL
jgi:hypothetical protein